MRRSQRWTVLFGLAFAAIIVTSCATGYQQIDGQWMYVTLDEAYGRREAPIEGADVGSFEKLGRSGFARDDNRVYYRGQVLEGADAATFANLRGNYWTDKARVYHFDHPLPGADPGSFRFLPSGWARDDQNIFMGADAVSPKDIGTFEVLNQNWARDSQWYYPAQYGRHAPIETLDRATFEVLKGPWARDCCRVFYFNRTVEGADPATFEAISDVRGRDKDFYYLTGFRQRTVQEEEELNQRRSRQK